MDGSMDGWMDGRTNNGRTDGWVGGWIDGWMDGRMDEWMDGWACSEGVLKRHIHACPINLPLLTPLQAIILVGGDGMTFNIAFTS
eukprot:364506-Chlamydomonas_euryale.AAC.7